MTELADNYMNNVKRLFETGLSTIDLKNTILKHTNYNLTYTKKLYAWILKEGEGNILRRLDIVVQNFDPTKMEARRCQDDSYLLAFDEIYNWMIEK